MNSLICLKLNSKKKFNLQKDNNWIQFRPQHTSYSKLHHVYKHKNYRLDVFVSEQQKKSEGKKHYNIVQNAIPVMRKLN